MPHTYVVEDNGTLVLERWTGNVTHDELIAHERGQLQDTSIKPGAVALAYAPEASFETSYEKVHELSDLFGEPGNKTHIAKYALLVNDATYDRAQMFARQAEKYGVSIIVFNAVDTACVWLGVNPAQTMMRLKTLKT
jgi:hypothetical protein